MYCSPDKSAQDRRDLVTYLSDAIDIIRFRYPDCGVVILGDFNGLDTSDLLSSHCLKQLVSNPTRVGATLDLILSNLQPFYAPTSILAPLGTFDHNIVKWGPSISSNGCHNKVKNKNSIRLVRRYPRTACKSFGRWIIKQDWSNSVSAHPCSANGLASSFTQKISQAMEIFFPTSVVKSHYSNKPWMTSSIKKLIAKRQKAYNSGDKNIWLFYRNKVKSTIALAKQNFYSNKIEHDLRNGDCRKWWSVVNTLSGRSSKASPIVLEKDNTTYSGNTLANLLNTFFLSVNADIPPLNTHELPAFLPEPEPLPLIEPYQVCKKLLNLNPYKACGPDNMPPRLLKTFVFELVGPISDIFNRSLSTGIVPSLWKASNISPIPKEKPPSSESDFRPISLTPCLAKVLEEFVAEWLINDIKDKIDPKQFGCLKGTSTSLCLLDIFHNWLSSLDSPGQHVRICYLDFSKTFDRINLNILVQKLIAIGARPSIINWISNFLSERTQRVKIGDSFSDWTHTHADVPQGTKLGPILFLIMVNDLASSSPLNLDHWIFVDDLTTSETVFRLEHPKMQPNIINLKNWSESSYMKLNPKKCKEMCVCFLKNEPDLQSITIYGNQIERVSSHKLLGVVIQDDLKWSNHIEMITRRAPNAYTFYESCVVASFLPTTSCRFTSP